MAEEQELLVELCQSTRLASATSIVEKLEKEFLYTWQPVGNNEANYGLINIGSDPGHALIERVTNAIDAVIEREAARHSTSGGNTAVPATPREAAESWFQIPGGRVANISDPAKRHPIADNVVITLIDGDHKRRPSIQIRDHGIGLTPSQIPETILSLSGTNKIDKQYLAGAYGQGGSTVLAFSPDGALFVSRRQADLLPSGQSDVVSVTFAKYEELDPAKNKNGRYSFLVTKNREIPHLPSELVTDFAAGTSVVHFNLGIERYSARMTQLTGSLWWLLQNSLFDPVLPIWAVETRKKVLGEKDKERRTIAGNYTRLSDDRRDRIEHFDSVEIQLHHHSGTNLVKVNYWVVSNPEEGGSTQPIDVYVDPYQPIAYTFFGQTHGTDERRFTAERLQLPYLSKFLIIQVELDYLLPAARRELLSSTRDRLKRTQLFSEMRERICAALAEDEELIRLNDARKEEILTRHSEKDRERMRERFAHLMDRLTPGTDAKSQGTGTGEGGRPPSGSRSREPLTPLPTSEEPTFIRVANSKQPISIQLDRQALLRIESDAPDSYTTMHTHARLTLACKPSGVMKLESKSDFHGGRARMTVKAAEGVKAGTEGVFTVFLFTPNEKVLSCEAGFRVESAPEHPTAGDSKKSRVKAPEPIPVYKVEWPNFGWDENNVAEVREDKDGGKIYVNADNRHLTRLLRSGGYQEKGIARMRNNFVLYAAFYAWAQHQQIKGQDSALSGKEFEEYQNAELDRVAQTLIHSIAGSSRLGEEG